jgi:nucleoside-diphosphate-sugar epimerase
MRSFVTGATGGLGRNLCLRLAGRCTGMGRNREAGRWLESAGVPFHHLDLADPAGMAEAMAGHDVVFHCAALSSPWGDVKAFEAANVTGTAHVLAAARQAAIRRVVVVSSPSVYFDFRHRQAIREDEPLPVRQVNAYAASKRAAEDLARAAAAAGQDCVILRPRGIIGPWDQALAPRLARVARRGWVPLPGGGEALVDVTCMANVVDALLAAATAGPEVAGRTYNISNGAPVRVADLVAGALGAMGIAARLRAIPAGAAIIAGRLMEVAARLTGGWEPPVTAYSMALLAYDQTLDIGAARRDLDWLPRQGLAEGLAEMGAWWREHHGQN